MLTAAIPVAASSVDLSGYTRVVLVYPVASCSFGGLGTVGCNSGMTGINHAFSTAWIPVPPSYGISTNFWGDMTHEMGHNLGLNHANSLDFGTMSLGPLDYQATNPGTVGGTGSTTASGAVTAVNTEYGDAFSAMGGNIWYGASGPYSSEHRAKVLGWIPPSDVKTVYYSGTYTVTPVSASSGLRALHVLRDPASSSWLWVEYRQPTGYYESGMLAGNRGNNMAAGAMVHYEDGLGNPTYTYQLDMTPSATGNNFLDGALTAGKTWSDPYSLLSITTNSALNTGLSVSVAYDTPCAAVALSNGTIPAGGGTGTVTVTAPSTCSWTVSTNSTWLTLSGTTSGTGNGTVTFTAQANTTTGQRSTYITAQRQSMPVLQLGPTISVLGVTPNAGLVASNTPTLFRLSYADAAGSSDVNLALLYFKGQGISCTVDVVFNGGVPTFYLLNDAVTNYIGGLAGGSDGSVSTSGCTLSAKRSGVTTSGTNGTLTMDLSFPASSPVPLAITAYVRGLTQSPPSASYPMGTVIVGDTMPALIVSPSSGRSGVGTTVTLEGNGTHFSSLSTVQVDGTGVSAGALSFVNASTLNTTLTVAGSTAPGTHTVTVTTGSEVVTAPFTTTGIPTAVAMTAGAAQVFATKAVTLTAQVSATGATPTGTVTFFDGDTTKPLGTATLSSGSATLSVSNLTTGSHSIGASYSGQDGFAGSITASTAAVAVTDFVMTGPASGITVAAGATTGNTATVTIAPGTGGFTTNIAFTCFGAPYAATCTVSPVGLTLGSGSIAATVTVSTTVRPALKVAERRGRSAGVFVALLGVPIFGLTSLVLRRRRNVWRGLLVMIAGVSLMMGGCSPGGSSGGSTPTPRSGTPVGATTLTITGTATNGAVSLTHTVTIALNVT